MKKFILKILIFVLPFLLIHLISYFFHGKNNGDLTRIGYLLKDDTYREIFTNYLSLKINYKEIASIDLSKKQKFDILVIGDSFADQKSYGFSNFLAQSDSIKVLYFNRKIDSNPIETIYGMINSSFFDNLTVNYILLQSVEREFVKRADTFDKNKIFTDEEILSLKMHTQQKTDKKKFDFLPKSDFYKFFFYNILYTLDDNAFFSPVYKFNLKSNLFSGNSKDKLLVFCDDLNNLRINNNYDKIKKLNFELNVISDLLKEKGIKLIVLPSPDKYSLYFDYIENNSNYIRPLFFKYFKPLNKKYIYIDSFQLLKENLSKEIKDLYFFDDSHWSPKSSLLISAKIKKVIKNEELIRYSDFE